MKVRTSLFFLSTIFVIIIVVLGYVMFNTSNLVNNEVRESESATQIIKDIFELNIVTYEYLTYHEERMNQQWMQKYDSLGKLLEGIRIEESHTEHVSILESITSDYKSLGNLFSLLQENLIKREKLIEENKPQAEIDLSLSSEKRLSSQALIRSQRMASEAFRFSALKQQRIAQVQQRTNSIALFSIIAFIVLSFSISFFTSKAIIEPLNELVKSTEIIGKGNLEHRVDIKNRNEIGELAVAFNQMTELRKRAEEELKEYSQHLEEKVDERTQELRDAQESLVRKERLAILGQLAGGVGHELRNPLGVISNAVYYLQTINPDADESTQEYLNMISSEVQGAEKIVSDLLDFSRIRMPERRRIGVSELVAQVFERKPPPENVGVKTEFPEDLPEVYVDPGQINQVLINLVVNAYQAMLEGGKLVIEADVKGDEVRLAIKDDGIGISPDHMKKLFEPLFTTKAKGIGLGLVIIKNLVETNQGTIKVESVEGVGSTFILTLPTEKDIS
jgi:signal transduction histidine kinase